MKLAVHELCTGCSACVEVCPNHALMMVVDSEGFLSPMGNPSKCTDCKLCETVCPVLHPGSVREPLAVYAAKAKDDDLRMKSSSGGMFTLFARETLKQGGIVYGAGWERP